MSGKLVDEKVPLGYRFVIDSCDVDCSYDLMASTTSGLLDIDRDVLLSASKISIVDESDNSIGNNLTIEILPPRGKMVLYIDDQVVLNSEVVLKLDHITNDEISKKVKVNGISGRMDIIR